ncbi:MAG TPA: DUF2231 domain-containing protein [Opitutaceae bacterium]|nr:DUF2231 domain-containing protein [Opitutaceae bacterium]
MRVWLAICLATLAFVGVARAEDYVLGQSIAKEVREVFRATCVECHGADLSKPKKDFGYVLDLKRVAANPDFVVRGKPDKSDLYLLIEDDEMPGENSHSGPLTAPQKELVKRWIELGAPDPDGGSNASGSMSAAPPTKRELSFGKRLARLLGEFHPVVVHFPIVLTLIATLAYLFKQATTCLFCLRLGAFAAPVAAAFGWFNAEFANYTAKSAALLNWHRWLGVSAAVVAILAWLCTKRSGRVLGAVLIVGSILVIAAGAAGGALVYGLDHYKW